MKNSFLINTKIKQIKYVGRIQFTKFILSLFLILSCNSSEIYLKESFPAKIIIIVMDGARYSETWGDEDKLNIPNITKHLASNGSILTNLYNSGYTKTLSGHVALLTGVNETLDNSGLQLPSNPNLFQLFQKQYQVDSIETMLICSKDKLEIVGNCSSYVWKNLYLPFSDCGIAGFGSGYRHDSITHQNVLKHINNYHPRMLLINYREPDFSAHAGSWEAYINGIKLVDKYIYDIWNYIHNDPFYKDDTYLVIINDHGRHVDNVLDGFVSHGCTCDGCKHVFGYLYGPNIKKGVEIDDNYDLSHINSTIKYLLHIDNFLQEKPIYSVIDE